MKALVFMLFVLTQINTLIIQLKDGKCHTIMGILNSLELASMIRRNMSFEAAKHPEALIESFMMLLMN